MAENDSNPQWINMKRKKKVLTDMLDLDIWKWYNAKDAYNKLTIAEVTQGKGGSMLLETAFIPWARKSLGLD